MSDAGVEGLGSGVTDGLAGEAVAVAPFALFDGVPDAPGEGDWLPQLAAGVAPFSCALAGVLTLELGLADPVAEMLVLGLGLPFGLASALALSLGPPLAPGLPLALTVWLAVPLPGDVLLGPCGAAVTLGLAGGLVDAADAAEAVDAGCVGLAVPDSAELACVWDGDAHGAADGAPVLPGDALPSTFPEA